MGHSPHEGLAGRGESDHGLSLIFTWDLMNAILRDISKGYTNHCIVRALLFIHSPMPFSCLELGLNFGGGSSHDVSIRCNATWQGFREGWLWKISTIPLESVCHRNPTTQGCSSAVVFVACGDKELKSLIIRLNSLPRRKDKISA